jgi:hypothetical protein
MRTLSGVWQPIRRIGLFRASEGVGARGRFASVLGFGGKRLAGIRDSLAHRLGRVRRPPARTAPDVAELLDVDREYREKAASGELPRIAPRRYTALFSNTPHAHRAGKTRDWVVELGGATPTATTTFCGLRAFTARIAATIDAPVAIPSSTMMTRRPAGSMASRDREYSSRRLRRISCWVRISSRTYCGDATSK